MRISAKYALTFGFSGLIIVLTGLIILSSSLSSQAVLEKHARTIMENIASYTIDKSQNHLEPARKAAQLTIGLSELEIVSGQDINSMVAYFYEHLYLYPQFSGIYFGSREGQFVMASRYNEFQNGGYFTKLIKIRDGVRTVEKVFKTPTGHLIQHQYDPSDQYDPRQRPWYKVAKEADEPIWTKPYVFFTSKKPGITTANPVYDSSGKFQGVIGVDIELDKLSTFISKLNVSANGRAFIISRSGDVIAHSETEKVKHLEKGKARLTKVNELDDPIAREAIKSLSLPTRNINLTEPVFTSFTLKEEKFNAMFAPFYDSQWPWLIGIYMPEDDYLGAIKKNKMLNICISLLAVLLALCAGLIVANKLNYARENAEVADLEKSQFLARMSHEIRTPMNAILGAGELLSETDLTKQQQKYVSIHQSAGEHLRDLVSAVLDISRIEAGQYHLDALPFDLYGVVEKTCEVFTLTARSKSINLEWSIADGTPQHLVGDPTVLKQVLVNLLGNALKFTHEGHVKLSVNVTERRSFNDRPDEVTLFFQVEDTGIGITEGKQSVIFERFTQADGSTSRQYGGTGLGLSISRNFVRLMKGEMNVTSKTGEGSVFEFTARFTEDDNPVVTDEIKAIAEEGPRPATSSKRILLVEDDERNRLLFAIFLKKIPHQLETAESGEEALAKHFADPYDLIFMDIEMPGMDGYEATETIREREAEEGLPPVPIVAVTAHAIKEAEEQCRQSGCTGYLSKPLSKKILNKTVLDILTNDEQEKTSPQ